ncbi:MAG: 23S rRNA (pseudouridine(1915)-N(3))-methyltransferase RlmH [Candidatus Peribacteraceae bacterium]|nr:23S rRNA (pseudouridine(1915)-N(3))-methyltransferase RlmH [Candidatus Peribacteraceae bacterium]
MHHISLLSVGKIKTPWIADGCTMFIDRLKKQCDFSERILNAGTKEEENERLLAALEKIDGVIVVLDERGKEFLSTEFASWIGKKRDCGDPVTFVLGGAFGLDDRIRSKAQLVLSLSRMTFPHELCKLVFLEQLYRAQSILAGSGYHH